MLKRTFFFQYREVKKPYPSWAQFIGTLIILSSQLIVPIVLIGRLICFDSAREEALEFLRTKCTQFEQAYHDAKHFLQYVIPSISTCTP